MSETDEPSDTRPTILVVEDEISIRLMTCRMLRALGYVCEEAADGREALRLIRQRERPFDLVLTDIVMPIMDGRALCTELAAERPDQRILCTSAYATGTLQNHGLLPQGMSFIQKPFLPAALAAAVRSALHA